MKNARLTGQQLGFKNFDYVNYFSATVEDTADKIARKSSDEKVKTNALIWKMNAIPACYTATVHHDPLIILLELWSLSAQMEQYFTTGAGRDLFGEQQPLAIDASKKLTAAAVAIAKELAPPESFERGRTLVDNWVQTHPLSNPLFARDSIVEAFSKEVHKESGSPFSALRGMDERLDDLTARMTIYAAFIPKQARWQAELMLSGVPDELVDIQESAFKAVKEERIAVMDAINNQRVETLDQIQRERIAAMKDLEAISLKVTNDAAALIQPTLSHERVAAIGAIDAMANRSLSVINSALKTERLAVVDSINGQRIDTQEFLRAERVATTKDVEQIALKTVDHAFAKIYWLLAALYLATILGGIVLIMVWKMRPRGAAHNLAQERF
ncbi:MAG: hypothetical protein L0226_06060 [Acidobacteria bacterium]|nr:hypothetical protein [Acidobacteriota bacterium]